MKENDPRELPRREYCFGEFTLDLRAGFLRRRGDEVTLRPKTFEVLTFLVERRGQVVSKSALIDAVWPDAAITDNSLAQCVSEIRRALADDTQGGSSNGQGSRLRFHCSGEDPCPGIAAPAGTFTGVTQSFIFEVAEMAPHAELCACSWHSPADNF